MKPIFQRAAGYQGDALSLPVGIRQDLLDVARALEGEPSIIGASAHLLGIGRRPVA
jgi:hypothetical protein